MSSLFKRLLFPMLLILLLGLLATLPAGAGDFVLSNNAGTGTSTWFISGEPSLVMNGFDLNARGIQLPTQIDRVSIDVEQAVPGSAVTLVIYQDANGGSPVDASIVYQQGVSITGPGVFTATLTSPVTITQPVVWIGFYLPVNFRFRADTSGTSVLTYWAWQPGSTFNLTSLNTAGVLGPADGSAPVSINMGGVAKITAELITGGTAPTATVTPGGTGTTSPVGTGTPIRQVIGPSGVDLSPLVPYDFCLTVLRDTADILVTYRNNVRFFCRVVDSRLSPPAPNGYTRAGVLYDIFVFGVESGVTRLPYAVTHCIRPDGNDLDRAVMGLAFGAPRQWRILPTVRFGDIVCAELRWAGNISYFLPNP
jgi:hypothetical protein